jgi:aminoglycoside/choline kinase family phosphotransferase
MDNYHEIIASAYKKFSGEKPESIAMLPVSGSNRIYFRVLLNGKTVIATYNPDRAENEAFIYISRKLAEAGTHVPEIFFTDLDNNLYLQQDLGDMDLFRLVSDEKNKSPENLLHLYKRVIDEMPAIQYKAAAGFDFSICYPRHAFDRQSMHWDLNYFKYHFLKLAYTPFHEQKLEDDFNRFIDFLQQAPSDFFLYRDFQSRNIMLHHDTVYFIDYQGGRKGALQYDLASLLLEAKTALPQQVRMELLDYYIHVFSRYSFFNKDIFLRFFPGFALIRILQAFGAYGYRGYFERKPYFLQSIPPAISTLKWLLSHFELNINLPHLSGTLSRMAEQPVFQMPEVSDDKLTLTLSSFSYRRGIPEDYTGNGGGFVFDCRALPNPGRLEEFRSKTGKDIEVITFLKDKQEVTGFIQEVANLVSASLDEYINRRFEHLMVSFGCTGGQHRSVYCAEQLASILRKRYDIHIQLKHHELEKSGHGNPIL